MEVSVPSFIHPFLATVKPAAHCIPSVRLLPFLNILVLVAAFLQRPPAGLFESVEAH